MVPFWFTLSALCFVGAAVLLYVDIGRRRGLGVRRQAHAVTEEAARAAEKLKRSGRRTSGGSQGRAELIED